MKKDVTIKPECAICHQKLNPHNFYGYQPSSVNALVEFSTAKIYCCEHCGFSGIAEEIGDERLSLYYSKYYNAKSLKEDRIGLSSSFRCRTHIYNPRYLAQLETIKLFKTLTPETRYLEIGSGKGDLFNLLTHSCLGGNFTALEIDESAIQILNYYGVSLKKGDIKDENIMNEEKFDVIFLSHTLEHFNPSDVERILKNIKRLLDKDGVFLCEVPNADLKSYPNACENIVPHLSFFTKKSLKLIVNKLGFKIVFFTAVGLSQKGKNHATVTKRRVESGYLDTHLIEEDGILVNVNLDQSQFSLKHFLKRFIIYLSSKILGEKLTAWLFNTMKLIKNQHPSKYLDDDTNKVLEDGENLRILLKL
jgi:SAM-dependent methyltransferase